MTEQNIKKCFSLAGRSCTSYSALNGISICNKCGSCRHQKPTTSMFE